MTTISGRDTVVRMLDLRLLETFREVAARGSFSAAAEALTFTQPAVSQHVARLEKQLGTKLFERDARGVTPTRAGTSLLRHAEMLLEAARRAESEVRAEAGLHVPQVRIGSFSSGASSIVPLALRELRSAHPDVRPTLKIVEDEPALDDLMAGRIDVALCIGSEESEMPRREGLVAELILEDPMLVALPATHLLARQSAVALDEMRDEQWLITCPSSTCQDHLIVRKACRDAGFEPHVHFESDDYQTLLGLTASGMGVAIIPSLAALSPPSEVAIRPIPGAAPKRLISVARRAGDTDPTVEFALDALRIAGRRLSMGVVPAVAAA